jgi:sigma-B regulation protein RsbU (phosphoserine phosphatase)
MSDHSLYATAACIRIDPRTNTLNWSVAGHPPPLLRRYDSSVEDLECTSVILGALQPELFDPDEQSTSFRFGDTVLIYTDGAFESRNPSGEFFGIPRLRETMAFDTPPREWSRFVVSAVERFRGKNQVDSQKIEDDLLVASLSLGSRRTLIKDSSNS